MEAIEVEGLEGLTEIGRGGFGTVYRATETDLNRTVAVKVLNQAPAEVSLRRLDRERRAMGVLSGHPNIVTIHRTGLADGAPFLVMEFLAGGSLADRLAAGPPMSWQQAVEIGLAIADAVEAAHRAGVLHRDIKPANILLTTTGVPKLGDFGIANVESVSQTSGVLKATVAHAPPEVLSGQEPDARSDVYSLASTIYELIAGAPAFVRPTDTSPVPVLVRITSEPVPDLDPALVPPAVSRCLQQAMAKQRTERPPSAASFGRLLRAAAQAAGPAPSWSHADPSASPLAARSARTQIGPPAASPAPSSPTEVTPSAVNHAPTNAAGSAPVNPAASTQAAPTSPAAGAGGAMPTFRTGSQDHDFSPAPQGFSSAGQPPHPPPAGAGAWPDATPAEAATAWETTGESPRSSIGGVPVWALLGGIAAALILIAGTVAVIARGDGGSDVAADGSGDADPAGPDADSRQPVADDQRDQADQADGSQADQQDQPDPPTDDGDQEASGDDTGGVLPGAPIVDTATVDGRADALEKLIAGRLDAAGLPGYDGYEPYADPSGIITVSIPTAWIDRADATDAAGVGIQAGTSLAGTQAGRADSGVGIFLYRKSNIAFGDPDSLLDEVIRINDIRCVQQPSTDFDHPLFSGRYRLLSNCVDGDPQLMSVQLVGELKESSDFFLQISIVAAGPNDVAGAEEILDSVKIWLNRL